MYEHLQRNIIYEECADVRENGLLSQACIESELPSMYITGHRNILGGKVRH